MSHTSLLKPSIGGGLSINDLSLRVRKSEISEDFKLYGGNKMPIGDNPFDDGLDFRVCPPQPMDLKLPRFHNLEEECKLIRWVRCMSVPCEKRDMRVKIEDFGQDKRGVFNREVCFIDAATGDEWYKGRLDFYYTRSYVYRGTSKFGKKQKLVAFRFVVKGDIKRVYNDIPKKFLIPCTMNADDLESYEDIFVYGGLDILWDAEHNEIMGFLLGIGHNNGWYTHHPKCSKRPINWRRRGDPIGHCEVGWFFVSPGRNFVFNPDLNTPAGRCAEEALRDVDVGKQYCYTEDAITGGSFGLRYKECIHSYQELKGVTKCQTSFYSTEVCQGLVTSGETKPWIIFFSLGHWTDLKEMAEQTLHLAEGNIRVNNDKYKKFRGGLYFYGFATQNSSGREKLKLVDLASNKDSIGIPADTELLLYLYNAGASKRDPV